MTIQISSLRAFSDNYIWMITNHPTKSFYCVDPGDASPVIEYAKQNKFELSDILITHHHLDHTGGISKLKSYFPDINIYAPFDARILEATICIKQEEKIKIYENIFEVLKVPGHTSSHICYYNREYKWLFCGDTLFSAGCGRVFDGTYDELYKSLQTIGSLPLDTQVYCAHEYTLNNLKFAATIEPKNEFIQSYIKKINAQKLTCTLPSTIAHEKKINPFLRLDQDEVKHFALINGVNPEDSLAVFKLLRQRKDNY